MEYSLKPLKWYKSLSTRKGRLAAGAFITEGERAIDQVVTARPDHIIEILSVNPPPSGYRRYPTRLLEEKQYKSISTAATPQGIMAVVKSPGGIYTDELPPDPGNRILLLEDIQDPGNTGTLIRTAAAFGYSGIIMSTHTADPLSPKCVQSSAGSVLSLWIRRTENWLDLLDRILQNGYILAATILNGNDTPDSLAKNKKLVLALGNEASGISKELISRASLRIRIPVITEKAESLNVASCGAICMYLSTR